MTLYTEAEGWRLTGTIRYDTAVKTSILGLCAGRDGGRIEKWREGGRGRKSRREKKKVGLSD